MGHITHIVSLDKELHEQEFKKISIELSDQDVDEIKNKVNYLFSLDIEDREKEIKFMNNPFMRFLDEHYEEDIEWLKSLSRGEIPTLEEYMKENKEWMRNLSKDELEKIATMPTLEEYMKE